jgi:hypothetical protein
MKSNSNSKSNKQKVCVLSFENIELEYRVRNQVNYLSKFYEIDVLGIGEWEPPKGVHFTKFLRTPKTVVYYFLYAFLLIVGRTCPFFYQFIFDLKSEYGEAKRKIQTSDFDIIHANEWDALFIAVNGSSGKNTKIIFDSHEFSTEQESESYLWRIFVKPFRKWLFRKYISKVEKVITVSEPIAEIFAKEYGLNNVAVTYNAKPHQENRFRKTNKNQIKIIHHGAAIRNRRLEKIIELSDLLDDRFMISLMVTLQDQHYFRYLENLSKTKSPKKVKFIDFVDYAQINNVLIDYDIGIPAIDAVNKNHQYALGSRIFDYVIAGLAIAVPPLDAYKGVVDAYNIGVVGDTMTVESLAKVLNTTTTNQFDKFKKNALKASKRLCLEQENKKLSNIYKEVIASEKNKT